MRRYQLRRTFKALATLAAALGLAWAPRAGAATMRPTGDVAERFLSDPRANPAWHAGGNWEWYPAGTLLRSGGPGTGTFLWTAGSHFAGTVSVKVRLVSGSGGREPRARVLFAFDPATGAHRWCEIAAGEPGRVVLAQTGSVRGSTGGTIQAFRAPVAAGELLDLEVRFGGAAVTVTLGGRTLFTAAAAPAAPGFVGFAAIASAVELDEFIFTAAPDREPCRECHAGGEGLPLAADIFRYWDGRWWDATYETSPTAQQGGHGDPGGKPALTCVGSQGCHDLRLPSPTEHRNGVLEGRAHPSRNSYHLREGFIPAAPENPWDTQVAFDRFCFEACHQSAGIANMRHARDANPAPNAVRFGDKGTIADGDLVSLTVDSDLSSRAIPLEPDFAPCVSCHDPHGTAVPTWFGKASNRMLRGNPASGSFCLNCHI